MSKKDSEQYSSAETARRRDEVVRRMVNTPPQPKKAKTRPSRKRKPTGAAQKKKA